MFDNVGAKIKGIVKFCFWFFTGICGFTAIVLFSILAEGDAPGWLALIAVLVIGVGPVIAYLFCLLMVGFGELIETNDIIAYGDTKKSVAVKCDMCNVTSSLVAPVKYIDSDGNIQYRKACPECAKKYNCSII